MNDFQVTSFKASRELFDKLAAADKEFKPFEVRRPLFRVRASGYSTHGRCRAGWVPRARARARGGEGAVRGGVRLVGGETC